MSDELTTKPARARCPHCKVSFFNDPIDIDAHHKFCPVLLTRKIKNLENANEKLAKRLTEIEDTELPAPAEFLGEVEDLPDTDADEQADTTDPDEDSGYFATSTDAAPALAAVTPFDTGLYSPGPVMS